MSQLNLNLREYVVQEGNAYRVLPVKNNRADRENLVNIESSLEKMITQFGYRGLDNPNLYYNEDYRGFIQNHRGSLNSLAEAILDRGDISKGKEVLYFSLEKMPDKAVLYDITTVSLVELLFRAGDNEKAVEVAGVIGRRAEEMVNYETSKYNGVTMEIRKNLYVLGELQRILYDHKQDELARRYESTYQKILDGLQIRDGDRDNY